MAEARVTDRSSMLDLEKVRHSSLELSASPAEAPYKARATAPYKQSRAPELERSAAVRYAFVDRVRESVGSAMGLAGRKAGAAGEAAWGAGWASARRAAHDLPASASALAVSTAREGSEDDEVSRAVDSATDAAVVQADPVVLRREWAYARDNVLPAGRARARLSKWDAKSAQARAKADRAGARLARAKARGDRLAASGVSERSLVGRWNARRQARLAKAQGRQLARAGRLGGEGMGLRAAFMRLRRTKAAATDAVFGWRGAAALAAGAAGCLLAIVLVVLLAGAVAGAGSTAPTGSLTGVEAQVARYLLAAGFSPEATAAVMGNFKQESDFNVGVDADDGYGTASLGLMQMTGAEREGFLSWCAAGSRPWNSVDAQMEWAFSGEPGTSSYASRWAAGLVTSGYYDAEGGYEARFASSCCRDPSSFKAATDLDVATFSWMACYERPGSRKSYGDDVSRLSKRLEYARGYYAQIRSGSIGSGQEYSASSEQQRAIADACRRVPSPGAGFCAMWVSRVYQAAGLGYPSGDACDMYDRFCSSADRSQLKVGMIVAVRSHPHTVAGRRYGHVGIYVGDGMVMDNVGYIRTISLDEWCGFYGATCEPRWGFAAGVANE